MIGVDDEPSRALARALLAAGGRRWFRSPAEGRWRGGVYAARRLAATTTAPARPSACCDLADATTLPGAHNWQNAAAAYAACARARPGHAARSPRRIATYPGLAHRQELIATIGGVRFVNDSKATNADAAAKALACYEPIYWIAGGRAKEGGLDALEPFYPRIAPRLSDRRGRASVSPPPLGAASPSRKCGTSPPRSRPRHRHAQAERRPGAVVLLSPACASFDQFANFEARGDVFRKLVEALCVGPMQAMAARAGGGCNDDDLRPHRYQHRVGRWWWTVDRWTLAALGVLDRLSASCCVMAASPAVAERIGLDRFYFVRHQLALLPRRALPSSSASRCSACATCAAWRVIGFVDRARPSPR